MHFPEWKYHYFDSNFTEVCQVNIVSANGQQTTSFYIKQ